MNIAIEASNLARPDPTGVGIYGINLISHIAKLDRENRYYLCYRLSRLKGRGFFVKVDQPNFRVKVFQEPLSLLFMRKLDLYHGLDARLCHYRGVKKVVTIHDVLHYTSDLPATRRLGKKTRQYKYVMESSDRIIANSHYTKACVLEHFPVPEDKIRVIHLGVEDLFEPKCPEETQITLRRYGIERPYLLYVGNIETRKNLVRTIGAFARIPRSSPRSVGLVLAGAPGQGSEQVFEEISRLHLEDRVHAIGYVPRQDLPFLYSGAEVFLFPSLYEGFGLPLLEAMACGTPVITSNVASLPEVGGDAALYAEPRDLDSIAEGIVRLLGSSSLREEYVKRGFLRIRQFTWDRCARQTLAVYGETLKEEVPRLCLP